MKLLLAALAIFAWEFVAHMFTPLGEAGVDYLPKSAPSGRRSKRRSALKPACICFRQGVSLSTPQRRRSRRGWSG